jgi:small-conductance mechanosensitive channel
MSVDQMLKHTNETIIVAFGENQVKVNFVLKLLGRILKKNAFNKGFGKNSPTAKEFIFTSQYDFDEAKTELIKNFGRFTEGPQSITVTNHPYLGKNDL